MSAAATHGGYVRAPTSDVPAAPARRPGRDLDAHRIDAALAELARARGPARRVLAALCGRFVARRAFEPLGFARLGDYARERLGLRARTLQDLAHVDGVLRALPPLGAALAEGRLTWTQVRLVARVAEVADVDAWIGFAEGTTARALAGEVRRVDRAALSGLGRPGEVETDEDGAEVLARETVMLRLTPRAHARWYAARQRAGRVAGEPVLPWQCLESVAAEVLSGIDLSEEAHRLLEGMDDHESSPPRAANGCAPALRRRKQRLGGETDSGCVETSGIPPELARLLAGLDTLDAFALDARMRKVVAFEQGLEARMAPLLRTVADARLHRALGAESLAGYVRERLGLSPRRARSLVRIERTADRCPPLRQAWQEVTLSWVQAETLAGLVPTVSGSVACAWVAHAGRVSVRRLQDEVEAARCGAAPSEPPPLWEAERRTGAQPRGGEESMSGPESSCVVPVADLEHARLVIFCPRDVAILFRAVLCSLRREREAAAGRLLTEGQAFEAMLDHAIDAWSLPRTRARHFAVFERDGWRCTVPGCSSLRNLHDHHMVFRSRGGSNAIENRTTLCAWHHLRAVHRGIVRCTGSAPHGIRFELGVRASGPPLAPYLAGDVRASS